MNKTKGTGYAGFPYQKRPTREKGEAFMKECIDAAIKTTVEGNWNLDLRADRYDKQINYDLANGIINEEEMYAITNPFNIDGFDREIQDYPLVKPRLNLIIGEEMNRRFDFQVRVVNDDAISEKEKSLKEILFGQVKEKVLSMDYDEEEMKKVLARFDTWKNYEFQDIRERMGAQILNYLWKDLRLQEIFNLGMEDVIIAAEEIYHIDIINNRLSIRRVNPLNLYTVRSSLNSIYLDDSDIIVEVGYENIGTVIDNYYDYLKPNDIKAIEDGLSHTNGISQTGTLNYSVRGPIPIQDELIDTDNINASIYSENSPFSTDGRVRVARVTWRSMRKVGKLTFYDELGHEQTRFVDENYKPNRMLGENVKWVWINEWWEGTKIADDIYVKMGPKPVQPISTHKHRISGSGYVGTIYNVGSTKARSMMDILRPYQYLYDEFMDRVKQAFAKFKGPMIELDFAKMPEGWEPEKWMHYAENMGYLIVDSFKEGNKGSATGKLAGNFNTTNKVINPDLGNYIQHHIMMLEYIEKQIGIISGINEQRLGSIKSSETVGGIERAVTQSSHITERLFRLHDNTKLRVLETLLEYAKIVWKNDKSKLQYVMDDMTSEMLEVDGDILNEADYGIFISDSRSDMELKQSLKQLGAMLVQAGKSSVSTLIDIYMSPSISSMRRKIESAEEKQKMEEQAAQQEQLKMQAANAEAQNKLKEAELALKEKIAIMDNQTKLAIETMKDEGSLAQINALKLELEAEKENLNAKIKEEELSIKKKETDKKLKLEEEKLAETKRSNKAKESLAKRSKSKN